MTPRIAHLLPHPPADWETSLMSNLLGHAGLRLEDGLQVVWTTAEEVGAKLADYKPTLCLLWEQHGHMLRAMRPGSKAALDDLKGYVWQATKVAPGTKCIATYHPARIRMEWGLTGVSRFVLAKVAREALTTDLVVPERFIRVLSPENGFDASMVVAHIKTIRASKKPVATDIEGSCGMGPSCIGFAASKDCAVVVPIYGVDGVSLWSEEDEAMIVGAVVGLLEDPEVPKIIQHAAFELFVLAWTWGAVVTNLVDDTMVKAHELHCELEKSLEFLAMLYTSQPWWKLEHRQVEGRYVPFKDGRRATSEEWFIYNGTDCCVTFQVNEAMEAKLKPQQRAHYQWQVSLLTPLAYMSLRGLRFNSELAAQRLKETQQEIYELQDQINREAAGGRPALQQFYAAVGVGSTAEGLQEVAPQLCESNLISLLTTAFCKANPKIKGEVTVTTWQPMQWNGKKWVKEGKLIRDTFKALEQGLLIDKGEELPNPKHFPKWLKVINKQVTKNVPAQIKTFADVRRFARGSDLDACRKAIQLLGTAGTENRSLSARERGELSTLLGIHLKLNATGRGKDVVGEDGTTTKGDERDANWFVYEHCKAPKQFKREKGAATDKLTSSTPAVLRAYIATEDPRLKVFMAWRDADTRSETLRKKADSDGRMRCSYTLPGTETNRLSCSESPTGSGFNLQTVTESLRDLFPADEGCEFGNFDLRGADGYSIAAQCKALGDDTMLLDLLANLKPVNIIVLLYTEGPHINRLSREELAVATKRVNKERWEYIATKPIFYGYCMTGDHELLTETGWKRIDHVGCGDKVASYDLHSRVIKFEHPSHMTRLHYSGNLYTFKGHSIDTTVTADHRMPYTTNGNAKCITAAELFHRRSGQLPTAGRFFTHSGAYSGCYGRLIAAIQSDGCYTKTGYLTFCFVKKRKVERLQFLLEANGVPFKVYHHGTRTHINVHDKANIVQFKIYGKSAGPKMLAWSSEAMNAYLEEYPLWDGHIRGSLRKLFAVNKEHLDWIDTFAHLSMMNGCYAGTAISGFGSIVHKMSLNNRSFSDMTTLDEKSVKEVQNEPVYCPTVSTGYVMARRNGKIFVTGNCYLMGARKMSEGIAEDSYAETGVPVVVSPKRCEEIMAMIDLRYPGIKRVQAQAAQAMMREGVLHTTVGWSRRFFGRKSAKTQVKGVWVEKPDRTTHGAWLSTLPQFNTTYATKMGLARLWADPDNRREDGSLRVEPLHTVHDSLNTQWRVEDHEFARVKMLLVWMNNRFNVAGTEMVIPASGTYGPSWGQQSQL